MPARAIRHPVLLLQEGDIADNKDAGLANRPQILDRAIRADQPVASAVKGPGAAEGAIPRTAARKFDRGAIERVKNMLAAMVQEIPLGC